MCGVSTLELTAYSSWRTVAVSTLPASVIVSNLKSYPACYYHIKGEQYKWMDGAKIDFFVNSATDVIIKLYGGSSRTNASFTAVTGNASVSTGQLASIDYSTGLIVMVRARDNRFSPVSFNFSYGISGSFYPWYEQYIVGPNFQTYFIVGVAVAGFMALLIVIAIIMCFVHCCRSVSRKNKVGNISEMNPINATQYADNGSSIYNGNASGAYPL